MPLVLATRFENALLSVIVTTGEAPNVSNIDCGDIPIPTHPLNNQTGEQTAVLP